MFKLDLQSRVPIYEQLKKSISELIMTGNLDVDTQLPSVRNVAREMGINPNTVQKAYQDLERDGIIYSVPGKGSYIGSVSEFSDKLRKEKLHDIFAASSQAKIYGINKNQAMQQVEKAYEDN